MAEPDNRTPQAIANAISVANIRAVAAATLDLHGLTDQQVEEIVTIVISCCCNGPVGTNRRAFNGRSVADVVGRRVANNSWQGLCREIATGLRTRFPKGGDSEGSRLLDAAQMCVLNGDIWPIEDYRPRRNA